VYINLDHDVEEEEEEAEGKGEGFADNMNDTARRLRSLRSQDRTVRHVDNQAAVVEVKDTVK
jgi:hypothetical protein